MPKSEIPSEMLAVEISTAGPPEVLQPVQRPVPRPAAGEVLIRVAAAGVNRPDCLQRRGLYPPPPGASDLPGLEVAGEIVATGTDTDPDLLGREVCALLAGGGYAGYCVAPQGQCLPVPDGLTLSEAAALPETTFTVWSNVFDRAGLIAGETLLVHGGASGIGTTAIQLGAAFGATVIATAGSEEKTALCTSLGAAAAINYRDEDFAAVVSDVTGGHGADVILDIVGAAHFDANIRSLATDGRLVIIGVLGGTRAELNLGRLIAKRATVTASTLRNRDPAFKTAIRDAIRENVWPLAPAGRFRPVIQHEMSLHDAAEAHRLLENNDAMGKIVLTTN